MQKSNHVFLLALYCNFALGITRTNSLEGHIEFLGWIPGDERSNVSGRLICLLFRGTFTTANIQPLI